MSSISFTSSASALAADAAASATAAPKPVAPPADKAPAAPAVGVARRAVDQDQLAKRVEETNRAIRSGDEHLQFHVHKGSMDVVVRLVDDSTHEVLREFPPEKFLDMIDNLQKASGTHVDVKR